MAFLDGVRGLAALYVVIFHAWGEMAWSYDGTSLHFLQSNLFRWVHYGHLAVVAFIVLSGYSLMLPVARGGGIKGGWRGYFYRRGRRILPPYYGALCLSLILIACVPGMSRIQHMRWDTSLPITAGALWSHLFLVHNLNPNWIFKINDPMWSIATEWQIYFLFPLLLWNWRRFGLSACVAAGCVLGLSITAVGGEWLQPAFPWFICLFAFGMAAASISFPSAPKSEASGMVFGAVVFVLAPAALSGLALFAWPLCIDLCAGIGVAYVLVLAARAPSSLLTRYLSKLEWLGLFSYSLYLIHPLVLENLHLLMIHLHATPGWTCLTILTLGIIGSMAVSYLFHLVFERPFMSSTKTLPPVTPPAP